MENNKPSSSKSNKLSNKVKNSKQGRRKFNSISVEKIIKKSLYGKDVSYSIKHCYIVF